MKVKYTGCKKKIFWIDNGQQFFSIINAGDILDMPEFVYKDFINNKYFTPSEEVVKIESLKVRKKPTKNDHSLKVVDGQPESEVVSDTVLEDKLLQGESHDT